jgi:anti-sigma B factor antagonist
MVAGQDGFQIEQAPAQPASPLIFRLTGTLDLTSVDRLRAVVGPACGGGDEVLLDLSAVDFCDSTGLGTLVWLHRQATGAGGRLLLAAPRRPVREILKISGVDRAIPVVGRNAVNGTRRRAGE